MDTIQIQLDTTIAYMLAIHLGWTAQIEDTTQEMVGDEFPLITNPVSYTDYIAGYIPAFVKETVLEKGRQSVLDNFASKYSVVEAKVKNGSFDELLLKGDVDGISTAVKASL